MKYIPLQAAAKKYGVEEKVLTQLISAGMIDTRTEAGGTLVAVGKSGNSVINEIEERTDEPQTKEEIIDAKFGDLLGHPITLSEAAKKYNVPRGTIEGWYYRAKYIHPIQSDSYPARFDEAEIAYLSDIYKHRRNTGSRSPLLDEKGLPYKLKLPDLARYRRRKKHADLLD